MPHLSIIVTPTADWLGEWASRCKRQFLVASPFVNEGAIESLSAIPEATERILVTRIYLRDFVEGASSLSSLCQMARAGWKIYQLYGLHAKVYICDSSAALVTSANATYSGLKRNLECGLEVREETTVKVLAHHVLRGFGGPDLPAAISESNLEALQAPVQSATRTHCRLKWSTIAMPEMEYDKSDVMVINPDEFTAQFSGWQALTIRGILQLPSSQFTIDEIYEACCAPASLQYPENLHVREKLRQQLQYLRDMALVRFIHPGVYLSLIRNITTTS